MQLFQCIAAPEKMQFLSSLFLSFSSDSTAVTCQYSIFDIYKYRFWFKSGKRQTRGKTKQLKEGFGGLTVPDSKKGPYTSVIPTEEAGHENKSFIQAQKQRREHACLRQNKLDLWLFHHVLLKQLWIFMSGFQLTSPPLTPLKEAFL